MFAERLDFIMKLTNTKASMLARIAFICPSHISRLRKGERSLPKDAVFLPKMSSYLAKHLKNDYQKLAMQRLLNLETWPDNEIESSYLVEKWLNGSYETCDNTKLILKQLKNTKKTVETIKNIKGYYYGPSGKREAVLNFLELISRSQVPSTLFLNSEENMDWLTEDVNFNLKWTNSLVNLLKNGNRIIIIHHLTRDLNEMVQAIIKWLPLYQTGKVEPFFYPKLRDGIRQRTLFIAKDIAAIVSETVSNNTEGMLNELIFDKTAINSLKLEFNNFLLLCKPLMKTINAQRTKEIKETVESFLEQEGDILCLSANPLFATLPQTVVGAIQLRNPNLNIIQLWQFATTAFSKQINDNCFIEITSLKQSNEYPKALPSVFINTPLYYTKEEYEEHLKHEENLVNDNFKRILTKNIPNNLIIFAKNNHKVIVIKTDIPTFIFDISDSRLINAFFEYLSSFKEN